MLGAKQTGTQTITTRRELPPWLDQMLQGAGTQAQGAFSQWQPSANTQAGINQLAALGAAPGIGHTAAQNLFANTLQGGLAGMPEAQNYLQSTIAGRPTQTYASAGAAQPYLEDVLRGEYLHGGDAFNAALGAASDEIIPQVMGLFNQGGRLNSGLAQKTMAEDLARAFAGLYGSERAHQRDAAQTLANVNENAQARQATLAQSLGPDLRMRALGMAPQMFDHLTAPARTQLMAGQVQDDLQRSNAERFAGVMSDITGAVGADSAMDQPLYENALAEALGLGATGIGLLEGLFGKSDGGVLGSLGELFGGSPVKGAGTALDIAQGAPTAVSGALKAAGSLFSPTALATQSIPGAGALLGDAAMLAGGLENLTGAAFAPAAGVSSLAGPTAINNAAAGPVATDLLFGGGGAEPITGLGAGPGAAEQGLGGFLDNPLGSLSNLFEGGLGGFVAPAFIAGSLAGLTHVITDDKGAEQQRAWTQLYNNVTGSSPVTIPAGMPGAGQQGIPVQTPQGLVFADPNNYIGGQMYRVVGDPNNVIAATRDGQIAYGPISQTKWFQDQAMAQAQAPLELLNLDPTEVRSVAAQLGVNIPIQTWNDELGPQPVIPERLGETTDTFVSGGNMLIDRPISFNGRTTTLREMWQERQRQGGDAGGDGGN